MKAIIFLLLSWSCGISAWASVIPLQFGLDRRTCQQVLSITHESLTEDIENNVSAFFLTHQRVVSLLMKTVAEELRTKLVSEGVGFQLNFVGEIPHHQFGEFLSRTGRVTEMANLYQCQIYQFAISTTYLGNRRRVYVGQKSLFAVHDPVNGLLEIVEGEDFPVFQ
ncbi:MAG: hypothetical protein IPJ71_06260 [Bdellovibrionales bacterium]|nr:hypothetical protein [Bdellovibrionales bacterium]